MYSISIFYFNGPVLNFATSNNGTMSATVRDRCVLCTVYAIGDAATSLATARRVTSEKRHLVGVLKDANYLKNC